METLVVGTPPAAGSDHGQLKLAALARAILDRTIRPRTADIRRLAEAVLDAKAAKAKKGRPGGGKKRNKKLAKIPGQKKQ